MKSINWILLVCLLGLVAYADETQEQQVERLIKQLRDQDSNVRANTAEALGNIGTPEALKAITTVITSFFPLFTKKYTVYE